MERKYAEIILLSMTLLTSSITTAYATILEGERKEETQKVTEDTHLSLMIIDGANKPEHFFINSESLTNKEIKITAPNGFIISPSVIPTSSGKQKVAVILDSSKVLTEGRIILRSRDCRSYLKVKRYSTALPAKNISKSPVYKGGNNSEFNKMFSPGPKGYTPEFGIKTDEPEKCFYSYFVNERGYGFKAYIISAEVGLYNTYKENTSNPTTAGKEGGQDKFCSNDGEAYTCRIAVTPDNRALIYRDGVPIDSARTIDYAPQPYLASGIGEAERNLLKSPNFEREFDTNPESKLVAAVGGWNVVIGGRWNSEQYIKPGKIDNMQDIDNHIFEIKSYKWAIGRSDGILIQIVDVVPNEAYTLSALLKGGIAKKAGILTGKMITEEAQNREERVVAEVTSDNWEIHFMDYTTSVDCKQLRASFIVGCDEWGNDIGTIRVDNTKLTGVSCNYTPKFGFVNNASDIGYFTVDGSGTYVSMQPIITINLPSR